MKQKIGVFVLSALLVLSLSACGQVNGRTGDNDILGDDYTTTERNYRQGTSPNNSLNGNNDTQGGNNGTDTRQGVLEPNGGSNRAANNNDTGTNGSTSNGKKSGANNGGAIGGNNGGNNGANGGNNSTNGTSRNGMSEGILDTRGNSYEQMVRNGLINDTDGDLTDGENPHS